jgi:uncharacterized membrane protein (DUF106 family)
MQSVEDMSLILIELAVAAVMYALFSVTVQRKLGNIKRVRELQATMKAKMDEYKQKIKNNAATEELSVIQKDLGSISTEMMKHQMKPMIVIFPLFIVVFYLILPALFPLTQTISVFSFTLSYRTTFIIIAAVLGVTLSSSLMIYDKKKYKAQLQATTQTSTNA